MTNIALRQAMQTDESQILELWDELSAYYKSINPLFPSRWTQPAPPGRRTSRFAALWNDPINNVGFVATADDTIVGFCRVELTPDGPADAGIHTLVVHASHRGRGIGRALMGVATNWCRAQGATEVSLDVLPANTDAANFHESLGFRPYLVSYLKQLDQQASTTS